MAVVVLPAALVVLVPLIGGMALYRLSDELLRPPRPTLARDSVGRPLVTGSARPGLLGVALGGGDASARGGERRPGARVMAVLLAPAREAGLAAEDLIVSAGGEKISELADLQAVLRSRHAGDFLKITIERPTATPGRGPRDPQERGGETASEYELKEMEVHLSALPLSPRDLGLESRNVEFTGGGGLKARGWYIPAPAGRSGGPAGSVILMHGNASNRRGSLPLVRPLHEAGFALLTFDFTGRGDSEGDLCTYGWREREDARQAVHLASSLLPGRPVALYGRSLGASVALLAAADPRGEPIDLVVADSPFASLAELIFRRRAGMGLPAWPFDPLYCAFIRARAGFDPRDIDVAREAPRVRVPVLLLHGALDGEIPVEHSERIARSLGGPHELDVLPDEGHNDERPPATMQRILSFLAAHLPAASPVPTALPVQATRSRLPVGDHPAGPDLPEA